MDSILNHLLFAFPKELEDSVCTVMGFLENSTPEFTLSGREQIIYNNKQLIIPSRVYCNDVYEIGINTLLSEEERCILCCILSRHRSGYVREKALEYLLSNSQNFTVPYSFRLLGDYVIEIVSIFERSLREDTVTQYRIVKAEDASSYLTIKNRMISYWNEYYRWRFPRLHNYLGWKIFERIENLN